MNTGKEKSQSKWLLYILIQFEFSLIESTVVNAGQIQYI